MRRRTVVYLLAAIAAFILGAGGLARILFGAEPPATKVDFARDILPVLQTHCLECHGSDTQEGKLRLDARATVLRGGISGPVVIKGHGEHSPLYRRVAGLGDQKQMPLD